MTRRTRSARLPPALDRPTGKEALRVAGVALDYHEVAAVTAHLAGKIRGADRVAVWATATMETCLGAVASLRAGVPVVPINPRAGHRELAHIVTDSQPNAVLAAPHAGLASALAALPRIDVIPRPPAAPGPATDELGPESPAIVVYTSGTTGPPKGVVLTRRAIASNLDALAMAWQWTADDVLVHALPLFHVHGLILGVLGPLRLGGTLHHIGTFTTAGIAAELAEADSRLAAAVGRARLLVSAPLPATVHHRTATATGQAIRTPVSGSSPG